MLKQIELEKLKYQPFKISNSAGLETIDNKRRISSYFSNTTEEEGLRGYLSTKYPEYTFYQLWFEDKSEDKLLKEDGMANISIVGIYGNTIQYNIMAFQSTNDIILGENTMRINRTGLSELIYFIVFHDRPMKVYAKGKECRGNAERSIAGDEFSTRAAKQSQVFKVFLGATKVFIPILID